MSAFRKRLKVDAILWDFDGTLADSAAKNIAITKQILAQVAPRLTGDNLPRTLQSKADYRTAIQHTYHWHDLYRDFYGMTAAEIEIAGPLWETFQMRDNTKVTLFDGVADVISRLSRFPQGICSANASRFIKKVLAEQGLSSAFLSVIGYEDLLHHEQKPAADGGLKCLQEIFNDSNRKTIIYVGDQIADVMFARGLGERLGPDNTVISVAVTYSGAQPAHWRVQPDEVIDSPAELTAWLDE
jgi:phosphoglycolate phosphatase-like HAD superfamily hydrolase